MTCQHPACFLWHCCHCFSRGAKVSRVASQQLATRVCLCYVTKLGFSRILSRDTCPLLLVCFAIAAFTECSQHSMDKCSEMPGYSITQQICQTLAKFLTPLWFAPLAVSQRPGLSKACTVRATRERRNLQLLSCICTQSCIPLFYLRISTNNNYLRGCQRAGRK